MRVRFFVLLLFFVFGDPYRARAASCGDLNSNGAVSVADVVLLVPSGRYWQELWIEPSSNDVVRPRPARLTLGYLRAEAARDSPSA